MRGYINWMQVTSLWRSLWLQKPTVISRGEDAHGDPLHLTPCRKLSFSTAAGLQFCSSSFGISSIPVARQHWELTKTSPRVGAEHAITMAVIWYWAMIRSPPSAKGGLAKGFFKDFSYIIKDQHPRTAEPSLQQLPEIHQENQGTPPTPGVTSGNPIPLGRDTTSRGHYALQHHMTVWKPSCS